MNDVKKNLIENESLRTNRILNSISKRFQIVKAGKRSLKSFEMYNSNTDREVLNTWKVFTPNSSFILCLVTYSHTFEYATEKGAKTYSQQNNYFWGYLELNNDFGHTLIRPETLRDKILELFDPKEVDFNEYKDFSRRYYVLTDQEENLRKLLCNELAEYLAGFKDLTIEFSNRKCLFRLPKSIDYRETMMLCAIGLKLDLILNKK